LRQNAQDFAPNYPSQSRMTSGVLLDKQGPESIRRRIKDRIEQDGDSEVADLHLWSIGPNIYTAVIAVVAHHVTTPEQYKARIPKDLGLVHISIEVHERPTHFAEQQEPQATTTT
jgi:Co/Zn/Cd efflux system component